MSLRLASLLTLLLLFAPGAGAAPDELVTVRLSWEPGGVGGYRAGRIPFRETPPKGVTPLPGLTKARYARIKMAGSKGLTLAFDAVAGSPRLWVDHDFDGDLRDEKQTHLGHSGSTWTRRQVVLAPYADEAQRVPLPLHFSHSPARGEDYVTVHARIHRRGTVVLGGRLRLVALTDGNFDVCFDDVERDNLFIDLDGDGRFQATGEAPERITPGTPFRIGDEGWIAHVTSPSGFAVEFKRAKTVPPKKARTWPDTTVMASGQKRPEPTLTLKALKARFDAQKDRPYSGRYGTVTLIGNVGTKPAFDLLLDIASKDSDPSVRRAALRALGNPAFLELAGSRVLSMARKATSKTAAALCQALHMMGHPKREAVYLELMRSNESGVVSGAARYLAFLETKRGRHVILDLVEKHSVQAVRYNAYVQGARNLRGGPPLATMRAAADDDYVNLQAAAVEDLAKLGHPDAHKLALALAEKRPVNVTIGLAVAGVLGAAGDARSVKALLAFLEDPTLHANVRKKVSAQLRYLRAPASVAEIVKALRSKSPAVRGMAAEILGSIPEPSITKALLKRARREKDGDVLALVLEALGDHGDTVALPTLLKAAGGRKKTRARRSAIRALARLGFNHPKVRTFLLALLEARAYEDRILALDAAGATGDPALVKKVRKSLDHDRWEVRLAAVEALDALRTRACIQPLIERLPLEKEDRVRDAIASALFRLTGANLYDNAEIWQTWWRARGSGFQVPDEIPTLPEQHAGGTQAGFYGIPVKSSRILFLIDQSGSMSATGTAADSYEQKAKNRLDLAVAEVLGAVAKLKNRARVNVILFHTTIHPWKDKLQPLNAGNRGALKRHLQSKQPTGGTNLYDGLELALHMRGVDTIFLLSDGVPGSGKYVAVPDILRAVRRENQTRRIAIHGISIGRDSELLRLLARENGGRYVRR